MKTDASDIYGRVREFVEVNGLVRREDRILLSLSAGKDSMALLDIMLHLKEYFRITLGIFHLNHCARGRESDEDERFLVDLAGRKGLEIHVRRHDFTGMGRGLSFEEQAREKRYELLAQVSALRGFSRTATAHTASDNAETILMRIVAGTGIAGLMGIDLRRGPLIRPLLCLTSQEVYRHLGERGITWRDDESNADLSRPRNHLRHEILPRVLSRFPGAAKALLHLGRVAGEYYSLLGELLEEKQGPLYRLQGGSLVVPAPAPLDDRRVFKYIVARALRECWNIYLGRSALDEAHRVFMTGRGRVAVYRGGGIIINKISLNGERAIGIESTGGRQGRAGTRWEYRLELKDDEPGSVHIRETGHAVEARRCDYRFFSENAPRADIIFMGLPDDVDYIVVRNRRPGDRISLGFGSKKIKELMIENKLDNQVKQNIPLLVVRSRIGAIFFGLFSPYKNRVSEDFLVHRGSGRIIAIRASVRGE